MTYADDSIKQVIDKLIYSDISSTRVRHRINTLHDRATDPVCQKLLIEPHSLMGFSVKVQSYKLSWMGISKLCGVE